MESKIDINSDEFGSIYCSYESDIKYAYEKALKEHGDYNSLHEAYGVIKEELDELWDEIKLKAHLRSKDRLRKESIDIIVSCLKVLDYLNVNSY